MGKTAASVSGFRRMAKGRVHLRQIQGHLLFHQIAGANKRSVRVPHLRIQFKGPGRNVLRKGLERAPAVFLRKHAAAQLGIAFLQLRQKVISYALEQPIAADVEKAARHLRRNVLSIPQNAPE